MEREETRELPALESRLVKKPSLNSHLLWQLHLSSLTEAKKEVGTLIIGNLGRDGYLKATLAEIAEMGECGEDCVEEILQLMHEFDPVGVAARDLQECLLIQAKNLKLEDDLVVDIITNHLHDLEHRNYHAIVKATGRSPEEIQGAIDVITSLDPKPGRAYDEEEIQYISPDIFVYKVDNEFVTACRSCG
jgi:RNA polymerase sigma-54 factor